MTAVRCLPDDKSERVSFLINLPNTLTSLRIVLIPFFCVLFLMGPDYYAYAGAVLVVSGLSDMFDGLLARKLHQETELGKILDPIADKLTLAAVVVCMWYVYHVQFPWISFALGIMLLKEIAMAVGGFVIVRRGQKLVKARWWGKVATVVFYTCMLLIVALNIMLPGEKLKVIVPALAFFAAAVMLFALIRYILVGLRLMRGEEMEGTIDLEKEINLKRSKRKGQGSETAQSETAE